MLGSKPNGNGHGAAARIMQPSNVHNTPSQTTKIDPTWEVANVETKVTKAAIDNLCANKPSSLGKNQTYIPLLVSRRVGAVGESVVGNGEGRGPGSNADSGRSSTPSDLTNTRSHW